MGNSYWIREHWLSTISALILGGSALLAQGCATGRPAQVGAQAAPDAGQSCEQVCDAVREAWSKEQYSEGEALLAGALKCWPESAQVHELRSQSLLRQGFARAAEDELEHAVSIDPTHSESWLALARVRLKLDLVNAAQEAATAAVDLAPTQEGYLILARTLRQQHRWTHATLAYEKALEAGADPCAARSEAASMCLESRLVRGRPQHIEQWLEMAMQALELDPHCSAAHRVLARFHAEAGQRELALKHARQALDITPSDESMRNLVDELERDPLRTAASF